MAQFLSEKSAAARLFLLALVCLIACPAWAGSTTVVISQIYTAGGNSGATYNADYVELFNLSASTVSLTGYALQYASATGTTGAVIALPAGISLLPGQRYLIQGTPSATVGAALPTPADITLSGLAMGAAAGKIYLTSTQTALTDVCTGATIVDFVGYGTTASCYEGTKYAPAPTTTLADSRAGGGCTDTNDNSMDFANGTPAPHNSSSAQTPCSGVVSPGALGITGTATPSSVYTGASTLLAVKVTPGTSPASTGIAVAANLSAFGGSSTQPLYDDGTHGDATANDGTYSYLLAVPANATLGANTIVASATDAQMRTASANLALTVLAPVTLVPIHTIQGNTPGTAAYAGQTVMTSGIVTGVRSSGFYLQAKDSDADADPATPEGIYVYAGAGLVPASVTLGTNLEVTGKVSVYPATGSMTPGTELDSPSAYTVLGTGNPLPTAVTLTTTNPSPSGGIYQLLRYQSMRVAVPSLTTTQPTGGTLTETAETYVSDGVFWGTVTGVPRPVREPGLEVLDPLTPTEPATIPRFDDNPEVFQVDSLSMAGGTAGPLDVTSNTVLTNVSGVMDYSSGTATLTIDATTRPTVTGGMTFVPVRAAAAGEITVGDQNMERFYNNVKDTTGAVVVTDAAYALRLAKGSLVIRNVLRSPDILCLEEIENLAVLTDLSTKVSADAVAAGQADPQYAPYLIQGNDTSAINVAFLVKTAKVDVLDVSQFGKTTVETGTTTILNDRPPLVLHAGIKRAAGVADYPLTVIVNHLRSLDSVTDPTSTGTNVRAKREQQAEFLANLIQGYQKAGEHVISVGDYNAFEFNDGLVDSIGIIKGDPAPANQDVVAGTSGLVSPLLVDAAPTNVATGTYSYVFAGNAQTIDHVLVTPDIAGLVTTAPAHFDADFPVIDRNDATRPEASSDHDGVVAYIAVPPGTALSFNPTSLTFPTQALKTAATMPVVVSNSSTGAIAITSIVASAPFGETNNCGTSLAGGASCTITVSFTPTATGPVTGTLVLTDSDATATQTIALSGTGAGVFSSVGLTASPASSVLGTSVALTATVSGNGASAPTGSVVFSDGTTALKTVTLAGGVASYSTTALAVGSHSITAAYGGDGIYPASSSAAAVVTVTAPPVPDFTLTLANSQVIVSRNAPSGTTAVNVVLVNGFSTAVSFACSGLPAGSHCTFSPATLTASGASTLTITAYSSTGAVRGRTEETVLALMLLGLPLALRRKARTRLARASTMLGLALLGLGLLAMTGCGGGGSTSTGTGSSVVTVTATGGGVSHTASVTLVVQ